MGVMYCDRNHYTTIIVISLLATHRAMKGSLKGNMLGLTTCTTLYILKYMRWLIPLVTAAILQHYVQHGTGRYYFISSEPTHTIEAHCTSADFYTS